MTLKYLKNVVTLVLNKNRCIGCKMCIQVCPQHVFEIKNKKADIIEKDNCMECGACMKNCPVDAIFVRAGVGCAAAILGSKGDPSKASCDCSGTDQSYCCGR